MSSSGNSHTRDWVLPGLFLVLAFSAIVGVIVYRRPSHSPLTETQNSKSEKRILFVDSYHPEYEPGIQAREGLANILADRHVRVRVVYMDAKRKKSADQLAAAAKRVKAIVEDWKPDLIIASDDATSKYLIAPYYKNTELPVVFIGVNWSAEHYGLPCSNVTGQVEVELIRELIRELAKHARGKRLAFISGNTLTDRKAADHYRDTLGISFDHLEFVDDFASWKTAYANLQKKADIVIFRNNSGISDWDDEEARTFVLSETRLPTGTVSTHLYPLALIGFVKVNREFGEYAGKTALRIFNGVPPSEIPVTTNVQARTYLNMKLAKKLGIRFPMELINRAHLISAKTKRLLYVNSYHKGYKWSDDLEIGLLKALAIRENRDGSYDTSRSLVEFKVFRMDTKLNTTEAFKKRAASTAKLIIDTWKPDLIVTSDDNAAKYLIVPYCLKEKTPVVFCGLNWDASVYGFPTDTITGILEVNPIQKTVTMLKRFSKGSRIGIIGAKNTSNEKEVAHLRKIVTIHPDAVRLVSTLDQWVREYRSLQTTVDMLIWLHPIGIENWNQSEALDYILENTVIPTGGVSDNSIHLALLGHVKIAEEQGWEAGKIALKILDGTPPSKIPVRANRHSRLYLNLTLATRLGIKFTIDDLREATFVGNGVPTGEVK
jgi:ABC-type uncharacterized transport system substrate-binding protein